MSEVELYRKHRPRTLDRVVGNTDTVASLRVMLDKGTLPHVVLFHGPSGTGKTTLARILAASLECSTTDLTELNCSDFRGIDTVRDIIRQMKLAPTGGPCRVWILDEVHQLSKDAQNSALKMLEDTPSHVYFFLCTTDPQKLLKTILTRCTQMPVRLLTDSEMGTLIKRVLKREKAELGKDITESLIENARGSARTALVLLGKLLTLPPEEQALAVQQEAESEKVALDLCRALIQGARWSTIAGILKTLKDDPEKVRWAVLGYSRSVLLGGGKNAAQAYEVICAFEQHFYDSKHSGLARACWEVINPGE